MSGRQEEGGGWTTSRNGEESSCNGVVGQIYGNSEYPWTVAMGAIMPKLAVVQHEPFVFSLSYYILCQLSAFSCCVGRWSAGRRSAERGRRLWEDFGGMARPAGWGQRRGAFLSRLQNLRTEKDYEILRTFEFYVGIDQDFSRVIETNQSSGSTMPQAHHTAK